MTTIFSYKELKASYEDAVVSLRYKNGISDYISSMQLAGAFRDKLIEQGYKEVRIDAVEENIGSNRVIQKCGGILINSTEEFIKAKNRR